MKKSNAGTAPARLVPVHAAPGARSKLLMIGGVIIGLSAVAGALFTTQMAQKHPRAQELATRDAVLSAPKLVIRDADRPLRGLQSGDTDARPTPRTPQTSQEHAPATAPTTKVVPLQAQAHDTVQPSIASRPGAMSAPKAIDRYPVAVAPPRMSAKPTDAPVRVLEKSPVAPLQPVKALPVNAPVAPPAPIVQSEVVTVRAPARQQMASLSIETLGRGNSLTITLPKRSKPKN